jgi:hypothetical protein
LHESSKFAGWFNAAIRSSVQGPAKGRDQLPSFFFWGHASNEISDALIDGEVRV